MKFKISYLFFLLFIISCENKSIKAPNEVDAFWTWFNANKTSFNNITDNNRDEKLDTILAHLKPIKEGLAVEVSDEFKGIRDIVISANSDKENFSIVEKIVKNAPAMKGWTVTAFRQRANEDFTLKYDGLTFKPSKMLFYPIVENGKLNIEVYINGIKNYNYDTVAYYGIIAMDSVLGEYDSVTKIGAYTFHELNTIKDSKQLKPVVDLPTYVDNYYKNK